MNQTSRAKFNDDKAAAIAKQLGLPPRVTGKGLSKRFAFFADDERFAVVAGSQEGDSIELALAYAIRESSGRSVTLVLPEGMFNATAQRVPWLEPSKQPSLFSHDSHHAVPIEPRTRPDTVRAVLDRLEGQTPGADLASSMSPLYLDRASECVWELVERVTSDPRLDPGHRGAERSWHFAGQRVLSIRKGRAGAEIRAGIHYSGEKSPNPLVVTASEQLSVTQIEDVMAAVDQAIDERRSGDPPIHRPDEHWLQAVIRRDPSVVGVEQPALREVPAWRPRDSASGWGRGFIDLLGLDGHGDIRIVETKLADNTDDLLVLQGLDYFVWAQAYEEALRARLGAPPKARLELHYVLGASGRTGELKVSSCTKPLADALDRTAMRWRFQTLSGWFHAPDEPGTIETKVSDLYEVLP